MSDEPKASNIARKLSEIAAECSYVQKDGRNTFHDYRYASAAAILEKVNKACSSRGIAVSPRMEPVPGLCVGSVVTVLVTLRLIDSDTGEALEIQGLGAGQDKGDKAVMKAVTAGTKYAWMTALSISTGDDPEADESTDRTVERPANKPSAAPKVAPKAAPQGQPAKPAQTAPLPKINQAYVDGFAQAANHLELPGEAVAMWIKDRAEVARENRPTQEACWHHLVTVVERVGRMKNGKVWLKRSIAEEDARRGSSEQNQFA